MMDFASYRMGTVVSDDYEFTDEEKRLVYALAKHVEEHPEDTLCFAEVHALTTERLRSIRELRFA